MTKKAGLILAEGTWGKEPERARGKKNTDLRAKRIEIERKQAFAI